MIDSSRWSLSSPSTASGDGNVGGYTAVSWADTANGSADDGLTVTPNGGDTTKKLFIPNAGIRYNTSGATGVYGSRGYSWSAEEYDTSYAWRLYFGSGAYSGGINSYTKLNAYSVRCVRS